MLTLSPAGLYCPAGDFHIDPWAPVPRAVVTHAHGDHLARGCAHYLIAERGRTVTAQRLGPELAPRLETVQFGERRTINGVTVSLHPAGHILGSAQVRVEHGGQVWVVSGDYKTDPDPTCDAWEPVRCHGFITETTFGLPLYRWPAQQAVFADLNAWWRANADAGRTSVLLAYALGKAQRLLAGLDPSIGPILTHGAVEAMTDAYRAAGVAMPTTTYATVARKNPAWARAIVIAPPGAEAGSWARRFGETRTAFASGWMRVRGARRRRGVDAGFTLSDHVDWPSLLSAIEATGAEQVWCTHGFTDVVVRTLTERGLDARTIATRFEGERDDGEAATSGSDTAPQDAPESMPGDAQDTP